MKKFALAALLALPALGLASQEASAGRYCCGERPPQAITHPHVVHTTAAIFDCDGWDCKTDITIKAETHVYAHCRNGWCKLVSGPFKNAFVLQTCLAKAWPGENGDWRYRKWHHAPYPRPGYDRPRY